MPLPPLQRAFALVIGLIALFFVAKLLKMFLLKKMGLYGLAIQRLVVAVTLVVVGASVTFLWRAITDHMRFCQHHNRFLKVYNSMTLKGMTKELAIQQATVQVQQEIQMQQLQTQALRRGGGGSSIRLTL